MARRCGKTVRPMLTLFGRAHRAKWSQPTEQLTASRHECKPALFDDPPEQQAARSFATCVEAGRSRALLPSRMYNRPFCVISRAPAPTARSWCKICTCPCFDRLSVDRLLCRTALDCWGDGRPEYRQELRGSFSWCHRLTIFALVTLRRVWHLTCGRGGEIASMKISTSRRQRTCRARNVSLCLHGRTG
jgi:hypothetical protein